MFRSLGKFYGGESDELASPSMKQSELNLCNYKESSVARKEFHLTLLLPQGDPLQNRGVSF